MRQSVLDILTRAGLCLDEVQLRWSVGRLAELANQPHLPVDLSRHVWQQVEEYEVAGMQAAVPETGAVEVLTTLQEKGYPLAVLTNNSRTSALDALDRNQLTQYFQAVLARDDVPQLKPAPDGVLKAKLAIGNPDRLIVIGDSWIDGVAARRAGARFIAVGTWREGPEPCPIWARAQTLHDLLHMDLSS
jgi:phosphoglycolate phosphatase